MKSLTRLIIGVVMGLAAGYLITTQLFCDFSKKRFVTIDIENKSGLPIDSLKVKHENGSLEWVNLRNGQSVTMVFETNGENTYTVSALLENGKLLKSDEKYVESGYKEKEIVLENKIESIIKYQ